MGESKQPTQEQIIFLIGRAVLILNTHKIKLRTTANLRLGVFLSFVNLLHYFTYLSVFMQFSQVTELNSEKYSCFVLLERSYFVPERLCCP